MQRTTIWHQTITWVGLFDLFNYFVKIWAELVEWFRKNQQNTETDANNLPSVMIGKKSRPRDPEGPLQRKKAKPHIFVFQLFGIPSIFRY